MRKRLAPGAAAPALAAATLALLLTMVTASTAAGGQPWSSTKSAFVECVSDATPQICDPAYVHKVRVPAGVRVRVRRLRYTASSTHCSSGRLLIYLNGRLLARTDWVDAGADSTVEVLGVRLKRRDGGKAHRFTYRMQGRLGGCNVGTIGSWAGEIRLSGTRSE